MNEGDKIIDVGKKFEKATFDLVSKLSKNRGAETARRI